MDSLKSSLDISFNSSLESIDIPGLVVYKPVREIQPGQCSTDDRSSLIDKIKRIYLNHPMSLQCLVDWVKLINTLLDDCEKLPSGKEQLLKLFRENSALPDIFFFVKCSKCRKSTKIQSDQKQGLKCCDEMLKTSETNFFVIIPIENQIVQSLKNNWNEVSKFNTSRDNSNWYRDVYDGAILKNILNEYKNSDINLLSLCLNVDGANKFKSNSFSVWPIQLIQNFLPPHIRFLPENIILNGLFYHSGKDGENQLSFHEYMRPLIDELNTLSQNLITIDFEDEIFKFKPAVTHCAVDLPAKSKIQETKQFGGYYACTYCEIPGEKVLIEPLTSKTKANSRKLPPKKTNTVLPNMQSTIAESNKKPRYYVRYVEDDHTYKLRDEIETLKKMLAASALNNESIDGIKDVSCLVGLQHFNIVWSLSVEYMHDVLQGVEKRLLNFFLNPNYSHRDFYIVPAKRKALNKKILQITPTSSIVRKPRSLNQLSNFKASEYRSMLLYYLPICLPGSLPNVYVKHVRLLSAATYILLMNNIHIEDVDRAEKMLHLFVKDHQQLFGKDNMVMVVHLVKHLAQSVRELGPLWGHSAFPFERNNGCLLKLVCGTTDVLHQISSKYCLGKSMNNHSDDIHSEEGAADAKLLLGKAVTIQEKSSHIFDIGSLEILNYEDTSLLVHKRVKMRKIIFTSELYTRPKRSIDYFVGLKCGMIGTAKYYFYYKEVICVMLKEFEVIDNIDHIDKVLPTNRLVIAPIDEIEKKYLYMNVGLNYYVTCRPNPYENE